jgi:hypothetical protein
MMFLHQSWAMGQGEISIPNAQCPIPNAQCPMPDAPYLTFPNLHREQNGYRGSLGRNCGDRNRFCLR